MLTVDQAEEQALQELADAELTGGLVHYDEAVRIFMRFAARVRAPSIAPPSLYPPVPPEEV